MGNEDFGGGAELAGRHRGRQNQNVLEQGERVGAGNLLVAEKNHRPLEAGGAAAAEQLEGIELGQTVAEQEEVPLVGVAGQQLDRLGGGVDAFDRRAGPREGDADGATVFDVGIDAENPAAGAGNG